MLAPGTSNLPINHPSLPHNDYPTNFFAGKKVNLHIFFFPPFPYLKETEMDAQLRVLPFFSILFVLMLGSF